MGTLYLVSTPIGNLEDMTYRAVRILREVSLIAAEDTRQTRKLLTHFEISTPLTSYHQHSAAVRREALVAALATGDVALVSDAGTPAVSDPGHELVVDALAAGYPVIPIPGASAALAALVASGLPTDAFLFLGFVPRKPAERREYLKLIRTQPWTLILYEAPHRIIACLEDALAVLGDRQVAIARELTKLHEEWLRGRLSDALATLKARDALRGEFTIVIGGAEPDAGADGIELPESVIRERLARLLGQGVSTRDAAARIAAESGYPRRAIYRLALALQNSPTPDR